MDFPTFSLFCQENGYKDELTIERKNVNGNYEPSNVIFIPPSEQGKNRRNTVRMEYEGETLTEMEWSQRLPVSQQTLSLWNKKRISISDGLKTREARIAGSLFEYLGEIQTVSEWSKTLNIPYPTLRGWVARHGWTIKEGIAKRQARGKKQC